MKKISILFILLLCLGLINTVNAEENYKTETLKEACTKENLTCNFKEKEYDESLPNIYVFRGDGCGFCKRLLTFLASIYDEYKNDANIVIYEVASDSNNWDLYTKVGKKFGKEVKGYPYMVVGKTPFDGYASSMDEEIKEAIKSLSKEEKYDVIKEVLNQNTEEIKEKSKRGPVLAFIFGLIVIVVLIFFQKKDK